MLLCIEYTIKEYQENESGLVIENVQINQIVNIFGCKNSTLQIKGKVNAITLGQSVSFFVSINN